MSLQKLSTVERKKLQIIFDDLEKLFEKDEIPISEIDDLIRGLKSEEVKSYISNLKKGKPEAALSDAFFAGNSLLSRYLASEMNPQVKINSSDSAGGGGTIHLLILY